MTGGDASVRTAAEPLDEAREYVKLQIASFVRRVGGEVETVRVRGTTFRQAYAARAALAQVNVTVGGYAVRAQAVAAAIRGTATLLIDRLREYVTRLARPSVPGAWPDGHRRGCQPAVVTLVPAQRRIVRRKRYLLTWCRPDEAALMMDVRDYDFHLFVDADTGQDSIVHRVGPTGYRLARLEGLMPPRPPVVMPWTIDVGPVPFLTSAQAAGRLDTTEMPYRFFRNATTGRGSVLYRRYDGHYGLITGTGSGSRR